MLRIAMITCHASPLVELGSVDNGGQNIYVKNIARNLAKRGHEIDIFTRKDSPALDECVAMCRGVRVIHVPAGPAAYVKKEELLPYMDEFADLIARYISSENYDLVHANFFMSGIAAMRIKERLGIPFFITFHALGRIRRLYQKHDDAFPDSRFQIEDRIIASADGIIAECPQDKQDMLDFYSADPERITVIPCGVDPAELYRVERRSARTWLGIGENERILLQLGRLVPRKGIETIIRALPLLAQRGYAAKLFIVGGDSRLPDPGQTPEIARLAAIAHEAGVGPSVIFRGQARRDEVKFYYSAADMFISTPWYEPFGITPLEAMACESPVIGSRVGGIQYTVKHAKTGLLVPPHDARALADAVSYFFENPALMRQYGIRGRERVKRLFTWEKIAFTMERYFERTISSDVVFDGLLQKTVVPLGKKTP